MLDVGLFVPKTVTMTTRYPYACKAGALQVLARWLNTSEVANGGADAARGC